MLPATNIIIVTVINIIITTIIMGSIKMHLRDFPRGAVVENLPANAGDTGLSPGPGRSHMPRSNYARVPQLLRLQSRA